MREHEVPTHVQAEDRVLLWFTFPQVVAMTAVCALSYGAYRYAPVGPSEVRMALAVLLGLAGLAAVVGKIGGRRLPLVAADLLKYRLGARLYAGPPSELVRSEPPAPAQPVKSGPGPLRLMARRAGKTLRRLRRKRGSRERTGGRMPFRPHRWFGKPKRTEADKDNINGKDKHKKKPKGFLAVMAVVALAAAVAVPQAALADDHWRDEIDFKVGRVRPAAPDPDMLHPSGPGLFGGRSVLGVREIACLWHPPGAGDETPLVERSGARALHQGRQGRRAGGGHHGGQAPAHPLPRRPAQAPPPLRRPHSHGQVHSHAPPRRPQDEGEGRGQGQRRHRGHRPPHRPGGRADGARPRVPHGPGAPHGPVRRNPLPRHQPAGHPRLRRPRPHRRLGGARREGTVGAVGAEDAVHPRTDRQDPPRGQRAGGGGAAVHHPRRAAPAVQRPLPQLRAEEGLRPLPAGVVGQGLRQLAPPVQGRGPRPGADPPLLLRIVEAGAGHPGPAPAPPSTCAAPSTTAASCWSPPPRAPWAGTWPPWWARPS